MQNNQLTEFNEGGLHSENPNGGIPQGGNNTVEQGETKVGNYVYSNRLSIDENMTKALNLPTYIKGKTFADASKSINNKFKDRNDKPSLETKKTLLNRLTQAQEQLKAQKQAELEQINQSMQANSQQIPDQMNGDIPQGIEEFVQPEQHQMWDGGSTELNPATNPAVSDSFLSKYGSAVMGAGLGAFSLGNLSQGIGASPNKNATALNGTIQGAQAGLAFGPVGAGVGALVGEIAGALGGDKAQREQAKIAKRNAINYNNAVSEPAAYGGFINNKLAYGEPVPFEDSLEGAPQDTRIKPLFKKDITGSADYNTNIVQNLHNIIGITPGTPGYGSAWGQKSDNAFREWQKNNQPDKYANYVKTSGKNYSLFNTPANNSTNTIERGKVIAENYFNPTFGPKNKELMGLTSQGYKYNGPETPDTTGLVKPETPFVEPTGVQAEMEAYYQANKPTSKEVTTTENKTDYGKLANQVLKYSPVLSNFMQLKGMTKPQGVAYTPLRNTYQYDPIDEARQERLISQEGNKQISAIGQLGASQGAMRNAITSVGLNTAKARSAAAADTEAQNRAQRLQFQQSQLGVNQYNTQMNNKAIDEMRMDQGNYDTQKSKFLGAIGTDLGSIGREEVNKDQIAEALGYSWDGKYMVDKKTGEKLTAQEAIAKKNKVNPTLSNMYGGYLKKNTKGY